MISLWLDFGQARSRRVDVKMECQQFRDAYSRVLFRDVPTSPQMDSHVRDCADCAKYEEEMLELHFKFSTYGITNEMIGLTPESNRKSIDEIVAKCRELEEAQR